MATDEAPTGRAPQENRAGSTGDAAVAFEPPSISLPKGGGAIRGIGEKFAANPATGTGSWSIPLAASPGRGGAGPDLTLAYDSGAGNGPFGFGWQLKLPAITRKTAKGLPYYRDAEESDVFVLSGAEDLVPALDDSDVRVRDTASAPGYTIERYRPRVESAFARIERWTRTSDSDVHWRSITRENLLSIYGADADSRIADPSDPSRVFSWLLCETRDDRGNGVLYEYVAEDDGSVDVGVPHERNRGERTANRYLKRVRYGNRVPLLDGGGRRPRFLSASQRSGAGWMFEVVLDYDEGHCEPLPPEAGVPANDQHRRVSATPAARRPWTRRPDPFSSYVSGFEVRTYRRCTRVLAFNHIPDVPGIPGYDGLARATHLDYADLADPAAAGVDGELAHLGSTRYASFIYAVRQSGYVPAGGAPDTYIERSLPPLEFRYSKAHVADDVRELDAASLENLPTGLVGNQWVDLDGEGVSGLLSRHAGAWFYKPNLGGGAFGPLETLPAAPSGSDHGRQQLLDLAGDGRLSLVRFSGGTPGFHGRTDEAGWEPFRPFRTLPNLAWDDPSVRFADLDGDGHADVLVTDDETIAWYRSLVEDGFDAPRHVRHWTDEEQGPGLLFADRTGCVYLADMSGDGLMDLVRIRNGEVCYWPGLGHGRFGAKVTMDDAPWFDAPDIFDQRRIRVADIDGSGANDIIYIAGDGVRLYFNRSGNGLSPARTLPPLPHVDDVSAVTTVDLLGTGTACLVWSSPLPGDAGRPVRFIDLMGGAKPHLLVGATNNMGTETRLEYAPSTRFYLADKRAGRSWITRLPFPVHVVERTITVDHVSGNRFVTRYAYHDGHFDAEREFRGFGLVEQWDTEELAAVGTNVEDTSDVPPVLTRTWFHTGVHRGRDHVSDFHAGEYYREPGVDDALLLDDTTLPAGLTAEEEQEACRALAGTLLRQEIYGLDGTAAEPHPYVVTEQNFAVRVLQRRARNRHAVFHTCSRETLTCTYEREPGDPRVSHALTLAVDAYGNVLRSAAVAYGRRAPAAGLDPREQEAQARTLVTYTENGVTNAVDDAGDHRASLQYQSRVFEVTGLAVPVAGRFAPEPLDLAAAAATEIPFEDEPTAGTVEKRLLEEVRTYYRRDDLTAAAPLGTLEPLGLPHDRYRLALTPGLLAQVFGERVSPALLAEGGYVDIDGDGRWWMPSGTLSYSPGPADTPAQELAYARAHFFLALRYRNPFHASAVSTETALGYDPHDLLLRRTTDALGNVTEVDRHDYRVLQAARVVDANGNRAEAAYDALGQVAGSATMGKPAPAPQEGDSLAGFRADLTQSEIDAFFAAPLGPSATTLLAGATTRVVYDLTANLRDPTHTTPTAAAVIARERHAAEGGTGLVHVTITYSDGFSRQIQTKARARAGRVPRRDAEGRIVLGPDGQPELTAGDVSPRWVTTGWKVFNNKGKPVRQYEPFYTDTHAFEFDVRVGVSPLLFYDPSGRTVGTLRPDHTWEKVVFDAWRHESWDANDTILIDPASDPDLGGYFSRLPPGDYLPTWAALRTDPAHAAAASARWPDARARDAERRAAVNATLAAATPTRTDLDPLGRTILNVLLNRFRFSDAPDGSPPVEEHYDTRFQLDVRGNHRAVTDTGDRVLGRYVYDLAGRRVHQVTIDAGQRRSLFDATGNPLSDWDDRGHRTRTAYDPLRRPTDTLLREDDGAEQVVVRKVYGESRADAVARNLRGRVVEVRDQAGSVTTDAYDFKGNLLRTERRLATAYDTVLDWSGPVSLDDETHSSATRFDALGRAIQTIPPHRDGGRVNVLQPAYDEGSLLVRIDAWLGRSSEPNELLDAVTANLPAVSDVRYDAKGRRVQVDHGNGVRTIAVYDPISLRLTDALVRRPAATFPEDCPASPAAGWPGCQIQSLKYAYDPVGNVTHVHDDAQQTIFFRNRRVTPDADFTYDAVYRLIEATGREHLGQVGGSPIPHDSNDAARVRLPHPGDGNAMARYIERYAYDAAGNLTTMRHRGTDPAHPGWTRTYAYDEPSRVDPAAHGDRLTRCTVAGGTEVYSTGGDGYDAHGNTLRMPHLQELRWDYRDQLRMTRRQAVGPSDSDGTAHAGERTWCVYGVGGERVRQVTETAGGAVKDERLYLGGIEVRRRHGTDPLERETLHVMDGAQRVALVETRTAGSEPGVPAQLVRYQIGDHLGSVALELDDTAKVISYEEYSPYGSSSYQAVRSQTETPKRYRHTGTERDEATGLQHNGARFYAPWLGRWLSCDPMGLAGGVSPYAYCRGNPVSRTDTGGMQDSSTTSFGVALDSGGVSVGTFTLPSPDPRRAEYVVAFGLGRSGYMETAGRNTGLVPINIQDSINIGRGVGLHFPSGWQLESDYATPNRPDRGGLYPMFSGHMAQEALEGNAAGTVHYDMRGVTLTPPLRPGTGSPGFSVDDFHSSSEARQGVAHLASTGPGERRVDIVIQHEDGVSTVPRGSNRVQGAPLPARLADRMPNIDNTPQRPPGSSGTGSATSGSPTGSAGSGTATRSDASAPAGGATRGGGGGAMRLQPSAVGTGVLGAAGRSIPLVAEGEAVLLGAAYYASGNAATAALVTPLVTAAQALPVAAGVGVVGAGAGHAARYAASQAGAGEQTANTIGLGAAVLTGAALGSFIPGVGTAVGAGVGAAVAGGMYLWSIW